MAERRSFLASQTSSVDNEARTPVALRRSISLHLKCAWDPCPSGFGAGSVADGLRVRWHAGAFVNPPFAASGAWLDKCVSEGQRAVFLLPWKKLHRALARRCWRHLRCLYVLPQLVRFQGYARPLNTAIALACFFDNQAGLTPQCMCWWFGHLPSAQRSVSFVASEVRADLVIVEQPSAALGAVWQSDEPRIILMPARLDLACVRRDISRVTAMLLGPCLRIEGRATWLPCLVLCLNGASVSAFVQKWCLPVGVPVCAWPYEVNDASKKKSKAKK